MWDHRSPIVCKRGREETHLLLETFPERSQHPCAHLIVPIDPRYALGWSSCIVRASRISLLLQRIEDAITQSPGCPEKRSRDTPPRTQNDSSESGRPPHIQYLHWSCASGVTRLPGELFWSRKDLELRWFTSQDNRALPSHYTCVW